MKPKYDLLFVLFCIICVLGAMQNLLQYSEDKSTADLFGIVFYITVLVWWVMKHAEK